MLNGIISTTTPPDSGPEVWKSAVSDLDLRLRPDVSFRLSALEFPRFSTIAIRRALSQIGETNNPIMFSVSITHAPISVRFEFPPSATRTLNRFRKCGTVSEPAVHVRPGYVGQGEAARGENCSRSEISAPEQHPDSSPQAVHPPLPTPETIRLFYSKRNGTRSAAHTR